MPVLLGKRTPVRLVPHLGEFDQSVLFRNSIDYEREVFCWLESEAADRYDLVIEIGANIGIYSVFFAALVRSKPGCRLHKIISFEPALEPFRRLLANLSANETGPVLPYRAAVADKSGFREFFEPRDHLTNGSLIAEFAGIFSSSVDVSTVAVHGVGELEFFLRQGAKALIKVDVEGYEPELLAALADVIGRYRPDLLVEVLSQTVEQLAAQPWLSQYSCCLVTHEGLELRSKLAAHPEHRDWLFRPI